MNTSATEQADVNATPLEEIDVSRPELFQNDTWRPWFARLRREAPVHHLADSVNGAFWSVTNHRLIKEVDCNHQVFSSEAGGIAIVDPDQVNSGELTGRMLATLLWEEIVKRFHTIEQVGDVSRLPNNFIRGIKDVPVRLHRI